jgi:hypothetical protein
MMGHAKAAEEGYETPPDPNLRAHQMMTEHMARVQAPQLTTDGLRPYL